MQRSNQIHLICESTLCSAALCAASFLLFSKFGFSWSDEGLLWYASQRTWAGELAIRDFLAYDPGRYWWNSFFFSLLDDTGLRSLLIAASAFGGLGLAASWYTLGAAKIAFPLRLFFGVALTIALAFPRHKVYEQGLSLLLVSTIYFVLVAPHQLKRWFFFGFMTGIAAVFGRNHGVFFVVSALLVAFYLLAGRKFKAATFVAGSYFSGVAVGYIPIIYFFVFDHEFRGAFVNSVLSVFDWQIPLPIPFFWRFDYSSGFGFVTFSRIMVGMVCIVVPAIYFFGFVRLFASAVNRKQDSSGVLLLGASSLAGIPYLHQAFDRADFSHIAQSTLPAFVAIAAILSIYSGNWRQRLLPYAFSILSLIIMLGAWFSCLPATQFLRAEHLNPGSVVRHKIGTEEFFMHLHQVNVLKEVSRIVEKCSVSDNEFLALPHFPGVYAYLGIKAPFWEMYYLFQRPLDFQLRHIEAIGNVKAILIAPDAAVDGLERLKLKNTYGNLLNFIQTNYVKLNSPVLPKGIFIYVNPEVCGE